MLKHICNFINILNNQKKIAYPKMKETELTTEGE